ncbi:MAG: hypothetical protein AAGI44_00035 [Pseudomonadota bacterium]
MIKRACGLLLALSVTLASGAEPTATSCLAVTNAWTKDYKHREVAFRNRCEEEIHWRICFYVSGKGNERAKGYVLPGAIGTYSVALPHRERINEDGRKEIGFAPSTFKYTTCRGAGCTPDSPTCPSGV